MSIRSKVNFTRRKFTKPNFLYSFIFFMIALLIQANCEECQDQDWCAKLTEFCDRSDVVDDMKKLCPIACGYCNATGGNFSSWSEWSDCSKTCDFGFQTRSRECNNANETKQCEPDQHGQDLTQKRKCKEATCGFWQAWQSWGECSATCGGGSQRKIRICVGGRCQGKYFADRRCNEEPCPNWTKWSSWSECSVTCGKGTMQRFRSCIGDMPKPYCDGHELQETTCVSAMIDCFPPPLCRDTQPWCRNYDLEWCATWLFAEDCPRYCGIC